MGMDLEGRHPLNESGVYFRANIWAWRPIHDLICKLGSDLISNTVLMHMSGNGGGGPKSSDVCRTLADRFSIWLEHNIDGHSVDGGCYVLVAKSSHGGQPFATSEQVADPNIKTESAYKVCDDHLQEFVSFLRNCGGFQVF